MNTREKLSKILDLLKIEREEDYKQYKEQVLKRSLKQRCEKGVTWYPIQIERSYIGTGEKLTLVVNRTRQLDKNHAFQSGSVVSLFAMEGDKEKGHLSGVIKSIRKNTLKLVLGGDNLPQWIHQGRLGINLLFDDTTYNEMEMALKQVKQAKKGRITELREVILGKREASFYPLKYTYKNEALNESQNKAVQKILEANDIAVIHGPPGTGKTTTLIAAIQETLQTEKQVLVCAPSNTATDLLTLRCKEAGIEVTRLGNPARIDESIQSVTLDAKISNHPDYSSLKQLRQKAEQARKKAKKFKRNFNQQARNEREALFKEARDLKEEARMLEDYIKYHFLQKTRVFTATLVGAKHSLIERKRFSTVFIDEAGQALAPACWIPILAADRVIFAGDHHQLPPTVKSFKAAKAGLARTLFEHCIDKNNTDVMLDQQYRMHHHIMHFSGNQFYYGKLKADKSVKYRTLGRNFSAIDFIDTAGCGFNEKTNPESLSTYNKEEAHLLLRHLALLINRLEEEEPGSFHSQFRIGIISPYKAQVRKLSELMEEIPMLERYLDYITVNTIDGFQGQECDIIYISLVRSNTKGEIGFLRDIRRMNVALTRAKRKLVVIGDSATLGNHSFYSDFLDYVDTINAYKSAWDFMEV